MLRIEESEGIFFLLKDDGERIRLGDFEATRSLIAELREKLDVYMFSTLSALRKEVAELNAEADREDAEERQQEEIDDDDLIDDEDDDDDFIDDDLDEIDEIDDDDDDDYDDEDL